MPRFMFSGRDKLGKKREGVLDASSESIIATQLLQSGITPLSIKREETHNPSDVNMDILRQKFKLGYPTLQDLSFFSRQMYALARSGVPIVRALKVVKDSVKNECLKLALSEVVHKVEEGMALGAAISQHPHIFPELMISLIEVGENTGSLDQVFQQMSMHFERELNTRKRIKMATRYPIMVIVVLFIAVVIINLLVIPSLSSFFKQFHAQLPLPTLILIAVSDFTLHYWFLILIAIAFLIWGTLSYVKSPRGHYNWDKWKIKIPIMGSIIFRSMLARFARSFSLCIRTGVPLLESISLISKATDNVYVGEKISRMSIDIKHGETLTAAAKNSQMFSPLVIQMFSIGEETGEIDRLLSDVANFYEEEVDYDVKQLGDLIEPVLLSILACIVLLLALGVYLPMWDLSSAALGNS
jgi:MSHA biogenesis protein MshG